MEPDLIWAACAPLSFLALEHEIYYNLRLNIKVREDLFFYPFVSLLMK